MGLKETIINDIISIEGGYVNDPSDSGGETNYGITVAVARSFGYTGEMRDLPRELAFDIYVGKYWDAILGDKMFDISVMVTAEMIDTAVNMGPARAITFLQRSLNVLNMRAKMYPDLIVDGAIGDKTIHALHEYVFLREENILTRMLNCLQGAFYVELAERREKDEKYVYGWFKNRVGM